MKKLLAISLFVIATFYISTLFTNKQSPINPDILTGEYNYQDTSGRYRGQEFTSSDIATIPQIDDKVLGVNDNKRIEIDLTNQRLYAYEGDRQIYNFLISSGKWGKTPTGTFRIWGKFLYIKMEGGSKELNTYYYLPNVPYVMFFYNEDIPAYRGFGIHGTYWHSNFGHPMSHGCINMKTEEAALLYAWANPNLGGKRSGKATEENPGTLIVIYGVAPRY